ncbi:MAG: molybdenum cofactor guanylyltransferase [Ktedonobacteraceae bacterium]
MQQLTQSTAIILAGGHSRRMGQNKALLPHPTHQHHTFVEHLATTLTALCNDVLLIAGDHSQTLLYTSLPGVRVLSDSVPDFGPLMGLYSGLSAMSASHALVVAVDMPFIQAELLSFLLSQPRTDSLLVPLVNAVPQVLLAVYPRSVLPLLAECLQQGRRDPRSLLAVAPIHYIDEAQLRLVDPELRSFINVNTPEELQDIS